AYLAKGYRNPMMKTETQFGQTRPSMLQAGRHTDYRCNTGENQWLRWPSARQSSKAPWLRTIADKCSAKFLWRGAIRVASRPRARVPHLSRADQNSCRMPVPTGAHTARESPQIDKETATRSPAGKNRAFWPGAHDLLASGAAELQ